MAWYKTIKKAVSELKSDGSYEYQCGHKIVKYPELLTIADNYPNRPEWTRYWVDSRAGTITEEIGSQKKVVMKRISGGKF